MAPVHVIVVRDIPVNQQNKWISMAQEMSEHTWKEVGCVSYSFIKKKTDIVPPSPVGEEVTRFVITEKWTSQGDLDTHFITPHFKRLVPLMDALGTTVSITTYGNALAVERVDPVTKLLVLFDSSTKCTRAMAELVAEGCLQIGGAVEVRLRCIPGSDNHWDKPGIRQEVTEATFDDVVWADGVACGTPTNLGCISWRMKKFWDDLSQSGVWCTVDGKVGCSFSSQGGDAGGGELVCMAMNHVLMNFGMAIFGVTDYVSFKKTLHYGAICAKAPRDGLDAMACRRLGTRLAEFTAYIVQGRQDCHPMRASKAVGMARWGYPGIPPRDADLKELEELNKRSLCPISTQAKPTNKTAAATPVGSGPICMAALAGLAIGVVVSSVAWKRRI